MRARTSKRQVAAPAEGRRRLDARLLLATLDVGEVCARVVARAALPASGVERLRHIPYSDSGLAEHRLDVFRPRQRAGPLPAILYAHGGAFQALSKETHWTLCVTYARHGFVVFNMDYRLAPRWRFPACFDDAAAALLWVQRHAADYGGDPQRIVLAGESAGANLATALTVAACYRRPEPSARRVFDAAPRIAAVVPACGVLQVTDAARFERRMWLPGWYRDILRAMPVNFLPHGDRPDPACALADPLVLLEQGRPPERPLPPIFAFCGSRDPLDGDTSRLREAVQRLGGVCEATIYEGGLHAFHILPWDPLARRCWRDQLAFLDRVCATPRAPTADRGPADRGRT